MAGNPLGHIKLIPSFRGVGLDIPRDKLQALFQDYVAEATAIVREQERLIDQIRGEAVDSPFVQRALEAMAKASSAVVAQDALVRELNIERESANSDSSS